MLVASARKRKLKRGIFNSWDRREWFFDCALSGSALSGNCLMPKMIRTQHNMFIGPAGWNMDHGANMTAKHRKSTHFWLV